MPTPASHSLDELEIALNAATAQMQRLFDENARVRNELAQAHERMRVAGHKLRVVAERLPQASTAEAPQEKAA